MPPVVTGPRPVTRMPFVSDEHELFRTQVRRFVDHEVRPVADAWEQAGEVPRDVLRRMGELGMLGIRYPEAYGGAAQDASASVVLAEELGRSTYGGFAITVLTQTDTASPPIAAVGTSEQKERYLPAIIRGETIVAVAMTEPGGGSDLAGIRTRADRDGDHYVLTGAKTFITNGTIADLYVVAARTDPTVKATRGISLFLVERGTPGFTVGRKLDKMGWRSSDTAELFFDGCKVPRSSLVGELNGGFRALMHNVQNERLVLGAQALGEAQAAIAMTLDYVRQRHAFGAPLWDKQAIRHRIAMLAARVEAARYLVYGIAAQQAEQRDCVKEVSMIKALCGELVNDVMYACVQFHGGNGFVAGYPIERMYRDARVHSIGGGATELMLEEVGKRL
jgi:acyl-CoA dehydrogenase